MKSVFRGEAIYTAEVDAHFPQLSVGDTLYFAALARAPRHIPGGVSQQRYAEHLRDASYPSNVCRRGSLTIRLGRHGDVRYLTHERNASWQRLRARSQWWRKETRYHCRSLS
jgi:hypothetical protein